MDEAPRRSKTYTLKGIPRPFVMRRTEDDNGWCMHKQIKTLASIELTSQHDDEPPFSGILRLDVIFYFNTPSASRSRKKIKTGDAYIKRPTIFGLIRFLEKVSMGIIFSDDSIIAFIDGKKIYDPNPRTEFTITELYGNKEKIPKNGRS